MARMNGEFTDDWDWSGLGATCDTQLVQHQELQVDQLGRVWPCCLIMNVWRYRDGALGGDNQPLYIKHAFENTVEWQSALKEDYYWNSLEHHTMEEIMSHSMYTDVWHHTRFNKPGVSACSICVANCGAWRDQYFKESQKPVADRNS